MYFAVSFDLYVFSSASENDTLLFSDKKKSWPVPLKVPVYRPLIKVHYVICAIVFCPMTWVPVLVLAITQLVNYQPNSAIWLRAGGGGALTLKGNVALKTPFFRPHFSSIDPTSFFWQKSCISRPIFADFLAPETHILVSSQKNQFQRPYFWKPGQHISTRIFVDYLPWDGYYQPIIQQLL